MPLNCLSITKPLSTGICVFFSPTQPRARKILYMYFFFFLLFFFCVLFIEKVTWSFRRVLSQLLSFTPCIVCMFLARFVGCVAKFKEDSSRSLPRGVQLNFSTHAAPSVHSVGRNSCAFRSEDFHVFQQLTMVHFHSILKGTVQPKIQKHVFPLTCSSVHPSRLIWCELLS